MKNFKFGKWNKFELIIFIILIIGILINAFYHRDSFAACISSVCGITYTILAGKCTPVCYLFGVVGSGFYSFLSFQNAIWGNLVLYALYYIPMQICGYILWNKNLKKDSFEVKKTMLSNKSRFIVSLVAIVAIIACTFIASLLKDAHPLLDSITTVVSILGMYFTVKRVIEQWIAWMIVNSLSLLMWIKILLGGARVYSTVIMWTVYLILSVWFFIAWNKDLKNTENNY